jgi:hypothetical protein
MFYENKSVNKQGLNFNDLNNNQNQFNNYFNNLNYLFNPGNSDIYRQLYASLLLKQQINNLPNLFQQDLSSWYHILLAKILQSTPVPNNIPNLMNSGMNLNLILMLLNKQNQAIRAEDSNKTEIREEPKTEKILLGKKKKPRTSENKAKSEPISENSEFVNNIQSEKKKKLKIKNLEKKESHFLENEKPIPLKGELEKYLPLYEKDKEELCKKSSHSFMSLHFPEMYRLDNFYVNIITRKEKWDKRKKEYLVDIKNDYTLFRNIIQEKTIEIRENDMNKVWNPSISESEGKINLKPVEEFLYSIEKFWPFDEYIWSQEYALEFLNLNNHEVDKTKNMIQSRDTFFTEFMNSKKK